MFKDAKCHRINIYRLCKWACILSGDCPGGVDVVPGDHADSDAGSLALLDGGRHLRSYWVLKQSHFSLFKVKQI